MEPDDFGDLNRSEGNYPLPAPPPPASLPEEWTPAHDIEYSQLNNSWAKTQQDLFNGDIDEDTFNDVAGQILPRRQKLGALKQQAEQVAKQKGVADLHEQAAVAKSIQLQDAQAEADTMPGMVKPIQTADGRTLLIGPKHAEVLDDGTGGQSDTEGVPAAEPEVRQNGDGTHTMTIQNGTHRSEVTFAQDPNSPTGWRAHSVQNYGPDGSPIAPGAPVMPPSADPLRDQARQMVGAEPPRFIAGPHGRPVPNPMWGHWDTAVRQTRMQLWKDQRSDHQEQVRRGHEERQKAEKDKRDNYDKIFNGVYDRMQKTADSFDQPKGKDANGNPLGPVPVEERPEVYRDQGKMTDAAEKEAQERFKRIHGHYHGGYSPAGVGQTQETSTGPGGPVEAKAPDLPRVPAGKADLAALLAEKARRESAKQPPTLQGRQYEVPGNFNFPGA